MGDGLGGGLVRRRVVADDMVADAEGGDGLFSGLHAATNELGAKGMLLRHANARRYTQQRRWR